MHYYSFTIKCNIPDQGNTFLEFDELYVKIFASKGGILQYANHERDSRGKLHTHGVVKFAKEISYKNHMVKGWHIYLHRLYDWEGWLRYTVKNLPPKEAVASGD